MGDFWGSVGYGVSELGVEVRGVSATTPLSLPLPSTLYMSVCLCIDLRMDLISTTVPTSVYHKV